GFVAAESDVLLDEGVEKLDRSADGGSLVWGDGKVDGDDVAAQVEELIVGLAQKFRDAGGWFHQEQQAATRVGRFRLDHDAVQFAPTTDKVLLDHTAENAAKLFAGAATAHKQYFTRRRKGYAKTQKPFKLFFAA